MGGVHPNGWRLITNASKTEEGIVKEHGLEGPVFVDGVIRRYEMALSYMPVTVWQDLMAFKRNERLEVMRGLRRKNDGLTNDEMSIRRGGREI